MKINIYKDDYSLNIFYYLMLIVIVSIAIMQRFPYLGISPLDYDEGFTVYYSSQSLYPWAKFLNGAVLHNYFPPLDFLLHHFVYLFFGITEKTVRFVPFFFDVLSVLFLGLLGKKLIGRTFGLFCALMWSMSPTAIYYSMQARLYSQFCFAFILYLFVLSCYVQRKSLINGLLLTISIIYGFNVHILFICVLPIGLAAFFIDLILSYEKNRDFKLFLRTLFIQLLKLAGYVFLALIIVSIFYSHYKIISTIKTTTKETNHVLYPLLELFNRLVIRVYDAVYADSVCNWNNVLKRNCWIIWSLLSIFILSLFQKKDVFFKAIVVLTFFSIPFFDILTVYTGGRFSGRVDIRFVYWFVPIVFLSIAYIFVLFDRVLLYLFKRITKKESFFIDVISFIIALSVLLFFDHNTLRPMRSCVQNFVKNRYCYFRDWIHDYSRNQEVDIHMEKKNYEWRAYDYINIIDNPYKSNITCKTYNKINSNLFYKQNLSDSSIKDYLAGKKKLILIFLEEKFPWNEKLFKVFNSGSEKVYFFHPPKKLWPSMLKDYEDIFGKRFINIYLGSNEDYTIVTNQNVFVPFFYDDLPKNLISNGDFSKGLDKWSHDDNIFVFESKNDYNYVEIKGVSYDQTRIWQTINMISGHVYKISFKSKSNNDAFAILRDNFKNTERYIFCNKSKKFIEYKKEFKPFRSGKHMVFFSCKGEGTSCFSDITLTDQTDVK